MLAIGPQQCNCIVCNSSNGMRFTAMIAARVSALRAMRLSAIGASAALAAAASGLTGAPFTRISKYSSGVRLSARPHGRHALSAAYSVTFAHQNRLSMPVGAEVGVAVLDDEQLPVTEQTRSRVDDTAIARRADFVTQRAPRWSGRSHRSGAKSALRRLAAPAIAIQWLDLRCVTAFGGGARVSGIACEQQRSSLRCSFNTCPG